MGGDGGCEVTGKGGGEERRGRARGGRGRGSLRNKGEGKRRKGEGGTTSHPHTPALAHQ